jgi:Bardet-Biedl syndrome 9 protein
LDRNSTEDSLGVRIPDDAVRLNVGGLGDHLVKLTVRVFVSFSGTSAATNVTVSVTAPPHVHCIPSTINLAKVKGVSATPTILNISFIANRSCLPTGSDAILSATYKTPSGEPRLCSHTLTLPLALSSKLRPPSKTAPFKLTLDTEHPPQPLNELFADFVQSCAESAGGSDLGDVLDASGGAMALGFQFWAIPTVLADSEGGNQSSSGSIIVSKAGGRYRVQADSLSALYLLTAELFKRLTIRLREIGSGGSGSAPKFSMVSFSENIPLEYYFPIISEHLDTRHRLQTTLSQLNDVAHQFRMVEKRLLARFKDRTPSALNGLDVIMRESYEGTMYLGEQVTLLKRRIAQLALELECGSKLVALLAYLKFKLSPMEHQLFESYLCPDLSESTEQGWEEVVEASLTYLLKTALAKNAKESALVTNALEMPENSDKLKKHFGMVIDRLAKGARLIKLTNKTGAGGSGGSAASESKSSKK